MAFEGILFGSFLVCGLLLQVSKGGFVGYHLITNGEHLYQAQHQQKTTRSQLELLEGVSTTDSSKMLNRASTAKGLFISKLIPGLEGYTSQTAKYETSAWNQNQYKNRTTTEPRLGELDRFNTTYVPGNFGPVTKSTGAVISKSELGQDINDVINPGYEVTDGGRVSEKHMPLSQHQNLTTVDPQFVAFHRINTTDVSEVFQPVTKKQSQNGTTTEPQLEIVEKINTTNEFEEFDPASNNKAQNGTATEPQLGVLEKLNTADAFEEFEPASNNKAQNGTATEPQLGVLEKLNTADAFEEFEPASNNKAQNGTATEPQLDVLEKLNTADAFEEFEPETDNQTQTRTTTESQLVVFDRIITNNVSEVIEPGTKIQHQNLTTIESQLEIFDRINATDVYKASEQAGKHKVQNLKASEPQLEVFDKINRTNVIEEFEPQTNNQAQNRTATDPHIGVFERINTTVISEEYEPAKNNQDQNQTSDKLKLGVFDKIKTTDVFKEFEPETNNQPQNQTIIETPLGVFERINTTDVSKEFQPARNNQAQNRILMATQLVVFSIINTTDVTEESETEVSNNTQQKKIREHQLVVFDKINITDVPKEFEPVRNYNVLVFNKSVHGEEMYNVITAKGHAITNSDKVSDTSLLQNQTKNRITTDPYLGAFVTVNATGFPDALEPISNSTRVFINQSVSEQEINKARLGNGHLREMVKQEVTQLKGVDSHGADNQVKQTNGSVTTRASLMMKQNKSKGKVQVQSVNRQKKGNEVAQPRKSRKHKGNIIMNQKIQNTSMSLNQTQNGTTSKSRLVAIDRLNTTDIPEELEPVTNSTGVAINKLIHGQQMQNNTLLSGHTNIDRKNISDTSLSPNQTQNGTATEPRFGAFDKVNTTQDPEGSEPVTNVTSVVVDQLVPREEIDNATVRSEKDNSSRLIKQAVTNQAANREAKTMEGNVRIVTNLTAKGKESKGQVRLHSSVRKNQGNEQGKAKTDRKQGNGTLSRLIKQGIKKLEASDSQATKAEARTRIVNILATKGKDSKGQVQLHSVIRKKQGNEHATTKTVRKQGDTVINPNKVSHNYLSTTRPQHRTTIETTPRGDFERVNTSVVTDELKLETNSTDLVMNQLVHGQEMNKDASISAQTISIDENVSNTSYSQNQNKNRTTKKSSIGTFYRVNTTEDIEEIGSVANSTGVGINETGSEQIRKDTLFSAQTINTSENASDASLSQNQTQNLRINVSSLGSFNRVMTPDNIEELEPFANATGEGINESLSGRQIRKDAMFSEHSITIQENDSDTFLTQKKTQNQTTKESHLVTFSRVNTTDDTGLDIIEPLYERQLRKGHTSINLEVIGDTSLSSNQTQNRTIIEPLFGAFDRVNTTNASEVMETMTNFTGVVIKQLISGQEQYNATLKSGQANESVIIVNTLVLKEKNSKGQVQLDIRKKKGNKSTKAKSSKKQDSRKGTNGKRSKN
ncbi:hypothetical protein CHS0354_031877 [Potamilus streckersoni]|uniref:Uncharacterized protein n=1 Tax=Potamilus streckersoni TaxID=2493646 RepID=A0AAE0VLW9_9BIVA|nr:hypothetical protein CHS0354_031877 [Potamilus streckersoni]